MSQTKRILIAAGSLVLLLAVIVGVELVRRQLPMTLGPNHQVTLAPGSVPIYLGDRLMGSLAISDLAPLARVSFVEPGEGKTQEGWLLGDVLQLYIPAEQLTPETAIIVSSRSRAKSATLTWAEVANPDHKVMFDLSNRGTLKLTSVLKKLDSRDEWVQDVDKIEVKQP